MNKVANVPADRVEESLKELATTRPRPLTTSESVGEHAISILNQADAHINDALDKLQRRLDEVRAIKTRKLDAARQSIREYSEWSRYCTEVEHEVGDAVTRLNGDDARSV